MSNIERSPPYLWCTAVVTRIRKIVFAVCLVVQYLNTSISVHTISIRRVFAPGITRTTALILTRAPKSTSRLIFFTRQEKRKEKRTVRKFRYAYEKYFLCRRHRKRLPGDIRNISSDECPPSIVQSQTWRCLDSGRYYYHSQLSCTQMIKHGGKAVRNDNSAVILGWNVLRRWRVTTTTRMEFIENNTSVYYFMLMLTSIEKTMTSKGVCSCYQSGNVTVRVLSYYIKCCVWIQWIYAYYTHLRNKQLITLFH